MPAHPVDVHVGQRLRLRRTMLGMSQEHLGASVGVTFQQIQKYEKGLNRIGSSRLFEFAKVLNADIAYFFQEFTGSTPVRQQAQGFAEENLPFEHEHLGSKEILTLVRAYYEIPDPAVRKKVLALVKTLSTSGLSADDNEPTPAKEKTSVTA